MAYDHRSGLSGVYDRTPAFSDWARVLFREGNFLQGAELMETQSLRERQSRRIGDLTARDGNRIAGAEIIVDQVTSEVTCTSGRIYILGDVRPVAPATLTDVPMTGTVRIGVRLVRTVLTELQEPGLLGLEPGTEAEGEPGAAREAETIHWAFENDGGAGDFFTVYVLQNGVAIDQTPPPQLSGVNAAIAQYDRDANGSYIVEGNRVTALGKTGAAQVFSISTGTANINGFKRSRKVALRHEEPETFDTDTIAAEPHSFDDGGSGTVALALRYTPVHAINSVVLTKEVTEAVTKGVGGSSDALSNASVVSVLEVSQGATTFLDATDYQVLGDSIDWSPGGAEPLQGSTYNVTYRYLDSVTPDSFDDASVTVSGGVTGTQVLVGYDWKLPRIDLLCLDEQGGSAYLKGESARSRAVPPLAPGSLFPIARVINTWTGKPAILNTDVRAIPFVEQWRYFFRLFDALDLIALERLKRDIDSREPVAKKGVFVDPFETDYYRDQGEVQTAAIFEGSLQLAIAPTLHVTSLSSITLLDYTEEIIIEQPLATGCHRINEYQNFTQLPGEMTLTPSSDFWVEQQTQWLSEQTRVFGTGNSQRTTTQVRLVDEREELLEFLREIDIAFTVRGFGAGEELALLAFDGVDITPAGPLIADGSGRIDGNFTVPGLVTAGIKLVRAEGAGGSFAESRFAGQGRLEIDVMQRINTIRRVDTTRDIERGGGGGGAGDGDPLAQTFWLPEGRFIAGVNLKWCAKGDETNPCIVEIVTVENGIPTREVITQGFVDMATVIVDQWHAVRWPVPVWLPADREFAFVVRTDDADHGLSFARIGDFVAENQSFVSGQPYSIGVMLSSSNARTWTPHQDEDLTFQLVAALFDPVSKIVDLGDHAVANCSDLLCRATVQLPTADARFHFEIERADSSIIRLQPDQVWELSEYITETVTLRAVLEGTSKVSPVLYPWPMLIEGEIATSGTYVTRAFGFGSGITLDSFYKARLPSGSAAALDHDLADDNWQSLSLDTTEILNGGWVERRHKKLSVTGLEGRLRITLSGGPAARPSLADFRAVTY